EERIAPGALRVARPRGGALGRRGAARQGEAQLAVLGLQLFHALEQRRLVAREVQALAQLRDLHLQFAGTQALGLELLLELLVAFRERAARAAFRPGGRGGRGFQLGDALVRLVEAALQRIGALAHALQFLGIRGRLVHEVAVVDPARGAVGRAHEGEGILALDDFERGAGGNELRDGTVHRLLLVQAGLEVACDVDLLRRLGMGLRAQGEDQQCAAAAQRGDHAAAPVMMPEWRSRGSMLGLRPRNSTNRSMESRAPPCSRNVWRKSLPVAASKIPFSSNLEKASADRTAAHL